MTQKRLISTVIAGILLLAGGSASAGKKKSKKTADKQERVYFRFGVLHLLPIVDSDDVMLSNVSGPASLAIQEGPVPGSGASVPSITIPAAIVGYVLPWLDGKLSIETILGTPVTIKLMATGAMANEPLAEEALGIPTGVPALGAEIGETKALPPMLTAVYRFRHKQAVRPYVGAGFTYMYMYDSKITNEIITEVVEPKLEIGNAFGVIAQLGVEARFLKRFYANADFKFIGGLSVKGALRGIYMNTPTLPIFETIRVGDATMTARMYPLVFQLGAGMNF